VGSRDRGNLGHGKITTTTEHFTVPPSVIHITVIARGAHGAGSPVTDGGRVHAVIPVTPGEKLVIYVGGDASDVREHGDKLLIASWSPVAVGATVESIPIWLQVRGRKGRWTHWRQRLSRKIIRSQAERTSHS
jgi:hypothetical protein